MTDSLSPEQEMILRYKTVFSSGDGRIVLGDIATLGHVFDNVDPNDPILVTERNFALTILRTAGTFDSMYTQLGINKEK